MREENKNRRFFSTKIIFSQKIDGQSYLMTGSADDGREHSPGGIVSSESGFAHAGAIVHDQSSNFVVAHVDVFV